MTVTLFEFFVGCLAVFAVQVWTFNSALGQPVAKQRWWHDWVWLPLSIAWIGMFLTINPLWVHEFTRFLWGDARIGWFIHAGWAMLFLLVTGLMMAINFLTLLVVVLMAAVAFLSKHGDVPDVYCS